MDFAEIISPANILVNVRASRKQELLGALARHAASVLTLPSDLILNALLQREKLGSTGLGDGVALPHTRLPELTRPFGVLARLDRGIDFDAIDGHKVDLIFLLLLPTEPHGEQLSALASVARKLRDKDVRDRMRAAADGSALYLAITR